MSYYNKIAKSYDELHGEEQRNKLQVIKNLIKPNKTDKLLDVGCGTGISSDFDCDVYSLDPSHELLNILKKKNQDAKIILASAESIPFPDLTFDYVISLTAVQNFDDIRKGLTEIKRVSKNTIILSCLNKSNKKDEIILNLNKLFTNYELLNTNTELIFLIQNI